MKRDKQVQVQENKIGMEYEFCIFEYSLTFWNKENK